MNKANEIFAPQFFSLLREGMDRKQVFGDIYSGVIVGIIALPLAIAFAIASGVSPEKGIITAVIAGFIISLLGGSRVQIGGPTGAFVVIVFSIIVKYGFENLLIATFLAGVMLVIFGFLKLGSILKYIPHTLVQGFTTGISLIIFTTQIKDLLGLPFPAPGGFVETWKLYLTNLSEINPGSLVIGLITIALLLALPRWAKGVPWAFFVLILSSLLVYLFKIPVDTIYSRYGDIKGSFSFMGLPSLSWDAIREMLPSAFSIALLGALESLLSAVVADGMIGSNHRSNTELIAQGLANMASPLFGGIPATGAIARTAANINNGGRTPVSGISHAAVLLFIYLIAMPVVKYIPLAALSGILVVVAWNMSEIRNFTNTLTINRYEAAVLLLTFFLTIFIDLTVAIPAGFLASVILFMKRMSDGVELSPILSTKDRDMSFQEEIGPYSEDIIIFDINGPLFFASVHNFLNIEKNLLHGHRVIILRFRYVPMIDTSGLKRLREVVEELEKKSVRMIISGANGVIRKKISQFCHIKEEDFAEDILDALGKAEGRN